MRLPLPQRSARLLTRALQRSRAMASIACAACGGEGEFSRRLTADLHNSVFNGWRYNMHLSVRNCAVCANNGIVPAPAGFQAPDADTPLVAIAGCGIGGVALAVALQQRGVRVALFERDAGFNVRRQGYGLTMQQGMRALLQLGTTTAGISSDSHFSYTPDGKLIGCYGRALFNDASERPSGKRHAKGKSNVHAPRQRVREVLMACLAPGTVQWGVRVTGFVDHAAALPVPEDDLAAAAVAAPAPEPAAEGAAAPAESLLPLKRPRPGEESGSSEEGAPDAPSAAPAPPPDALADAVPPAVSSATAAAPPGPPVATGVTVHLSSGPPLEADVLVGADGFFSAVREAKLPGVAPKRYMGIMVILGIAPAPVHPLTDGSKVFQTLDGVTRIYAMPFAAPCTPGSPCLATADGSPCAGACRGSVMWQLSFPLPEEDARALSGRQAALKDEALRRCTGWHAPVPAVLAATAESVVTGYPVYDRAVPTAAEFAGHPLSCVTMIGDACHPMSPFKGQGANQAMLDAIALARALRRCFGGSRPPLEGRLDNLRPARLPAPSAGPRTALAAALRAFEAEMLLRAEPKVAMSRNAAVFLHSTAALTPANCVRATAAARALEGAELQAGEVSLLTEEEVARARAFAEAAALTPVG